MKINSHLRDAHGYSLAESVALAPWELIRIHDDTHRETDCGHTHTHDNDEGGTEWAASPSSI